MIPAGAGLPMGRTNLSTLEAVALTGWRECRSAALFETDQRRLVEHPQQIGKSPINRLGDFRLYGDFYLVVGTRKVGIRAYLDVRMIGCEAVKPRGNVEF